MLLFIVLAGVCAFKHYSATLSKLVVAVDSSCDMFQMVCNDCPNSVSCHVCRCCCGCLFERC